MGLIEKELSIVRIKELLKLELAIPKYQRPYSWSIESANTLFIDTYNAYRQKTDEYRLGSIILHKKDKKYYIVDGQQRLTTLSILLYCLNEIETNNLLEEKYSTISANNIVNNLEILNKKVSELKDEELSKYKSYLLDNCTIVKIVTDKEQEAFQFFDSQNSRGKALSPHDLLKAYHLREMNDVEENIKIKIVNTWENKKQEELEKLFENHLFPLTQWYRWKNGLDYSSKNIKVFKGIKNKNIYNYAIYQKASNLYIENMNNNGSIEVLGGTKLNQFQLTQSLIAGKRFFEYTNHYDGLLKRIRNKINEFHEVGEIPNTGQGDRYTKQLYENVLLFFADRFGIDSITDSVIKQLYTWSYSIRLRMQLVYPQTINNYAQGKHDRINQDLDMFAKINEMLEPEELNFIILDKINEEDIKQQIVKYKKVWEFIEDK